MENQKQNKFNGKYAELVSVEYFRDFPFGRTLIIEKDPIKGQRETCLYHTNNKINSEICCNSEILFGAIK